VRLLFAVDQIDELVDDVAGAEIPTHVEEFLRFLIQGAKRRAFWIIGTLADARLSRWNRLVREDAEIIKYWPLGNPDWEGLNEIVETSFSALELPLDPLLRKTLVESCQNLDRERTAVLPLLSVAMTRLADSIGEIATKAAEATGESMANAFHSVLTEKIFQSLVSRADVTSTMDELAEQAWTESLTEGGQSAASQSLDVGRFFRRMIAVIRSADREIVSLQSCSMHDTVLSQFAPLINGLRKRRILTDVPENRIQFAHEAVIRHWSRAQRWFQESHTLLAGLDTIRTLAGNWENARPEIKVGMLLPAGYCRQAEQILVSWRTEHELIPKEYILTSLVANAPTFARQQNETGWYPLGVAAYLGERSLAVAYLDAGAEVDARGPDGQTAMHFSAESDSSAIVSELIDRGATVNARSADGQSPLHRAAAAGAVEALRVILNSGSFVDQTDDKGWTGLYRASEAGRLNTVELLLDAGAEVDPPSGSPTPLAAAVQQGHQDVVERLLKAGANPTLNRGGLTVRETGASASNSALIIASETPERNECLKLLLSTGAAINPDVLAEALQTARTVRKPAGYAASSRGTSPHRVRSFQESTSAAFGCGEGRHMDDRRIPRCGESNRST
jgi:ankyrin repeat protein